MRRHAPGRRAGIVVERDHFVHKASIKAE